MMLAKEELKRYSRQTILPEIGFLGQEKLKNAKVLMIGAGGLGCPILQYLVAAGVGNIGIIDDDVVSISNLHRQILYSSTDIGEMKVIVAKKKLEVLNENVSIIAYAERLTSANAEHIFCNYELVIDGSDNFETRYLVNDTCVSLKKTLVFGSIFKFEGQISVFNYQNGPNYRDLFPEPPAPEDVPNCAEAGVIGVLPGIIGTYMANEAIKVICGIGELLSGKLMSINALDNSTHVFNIGKQKKTIETKEIISNEPEKTNSNEINFSELKDQDNVLLIDVREAFEFEEYNIGGINIPLYELMDRIDELPPDKTLIFCCENGYRSKMAIHLLKPINKWKMFSLKGGVLGIRRSGLQIRS